MAASPVCAFVLGVGMSLGGTCEDGAVGKDVQKSASNWMLPQPEKAAPPEMPPVVHVIEKKVYVQAPLSENTPPTPPDAGVSEEVEDASSESAVRNHILSLWEARPRPLTLTAYQSVYGHGAAPLPSVQDTIAKLPPMTLPAALKKPKEDYTGPRRLSTGPVDNSRVVTTDRFITGILETGINSQIDSQGRGGVIIQVSRPVFGAHGRNVLIPKGSRLVCDVQPVADMGASRLDIICRHMFLGESRAEIRNLDSMVVDQQGHLSVAGAVDGRFMERYGTAFLLTGISTGVRMATALTQTGNGHPGASQQASELAASELSTRLGDITASVLEKSVSLKPIITVSQGTRIHIRPQTNWYIKTVR